MGARVPGGEHEPPSLGESLNAVAHRLRRVFGRRPVVLGAGAVGIGLVVLLVVGVARLFTRDLSPDTIARIEATCRTPKQATAAELETTAPPTATDGEAFIRGLEQLPFLAALLAQRSTAYEEAQTTPPAELARRAKEHALRATDLALDVAACYERELARYPKLRPAATALVAELRMQRAEISTTDFSPLYTTGEPATVVIELAPREERTVRFRTLCIDRFAPPPRAGARYILGGTVDELKKRTLCEVLRGAQAGGSLAPAQNAVWRLEQERMDPATPSVAPTAGAVGIFAAQRERKLGVQAVATGTLTALDVTLANYTSAPLVIDTSCAYFVPFSLPDVTKPLPTPPPDFSDPATAERFTQDIERQTLRNLEEQEKNFQRLGIPFPPQLKAEQERLRAKFESASPAPEVKGVYSSVFLPGAGNVDPDTLDPFQPVQTGLGWQPLGTVGVTGARPSRGAAKIAELREVFRRKATASAETRQRLEDALDAFARNRSPETVEDVLRELRRCEIDLCAPVSEMDRAWESVRSYADTLVDQAVNRVIASITAGTLQDAIDAIRFCQSVGCSAAEDAARLDRHLRGVLRDRYRRNVPPATNE